MRLKRLETYGFKSFADRLTFDFESGITAVIGPNGCGKSNVVDSIKWVVGEQSAKALRGASMDDVIFNGCATRRPMPLAEATLVLEREVPDGLEELAITRRLTRDGQSAYYLNGRPSRLKDIRESLMGTGIGNSAYSVIEQGRIGFILEASVKDRRGIIEEAAGISRYRQRRKVAIRKLDRVDTDLQRIDQVHGEVEKRLRTVRRQAETALRYQELSTRLRDLRMVFALEEFGRLNTEQDGLGTRIGELQEQEAVTAKRLGELEALLAEADASLIGIEERIGTIETERSEARSRRDVAEAQLRDGRNRLVEIDEREAEDKQSLVQLAERRAKLQDERKQTEDTLERADVDGDTELNRLYRIRRDELDALLARIDELIQTTEQRKGREVEVLRELSTCEAKLGSLESTKAGLLERQKRIADRSQGHADSLDGAQSREKEQQTAVSAAEERAAEAHGKLDELIRVREETQAESGRLESRLNDLRHEEGRAEVRKRLLSEYENKLEGVFRGVKDVLQQMNRLQGICGIVADCFQVDKKHELAIETALGGRAQNIITETQHAAKDAIDFLKRERRGRATFLPLDDVRARNYDIRDIVKEPGVIGRASDLVKFDKKFSPAFEYLLGGTLICESLDHAMAVRRKHRSGMMLVTLDGDQINPGGAMTGGKQQGRDAGGLVSRKNEIRRLEQSLEKIATERSELADAHEANKKKAFDAAVQVEEQRQVIQTKEREVGEAKAQLMKAERDRSHLEEFSANFGAELEEIRLEIERIDTDASELQEGQSSLQGISKDLEGELSDLQGKLQELGGERERLQEEVSNLRVNLATSEERREALRNHLGHLDRQMQELADQEEERNRRIEGSDRRRQEMQAQIATNEEEFGQQSTRFDSLSEEYQQLSKQRDELRSSQEGERQEAKQLDRRARGLERERSELEAKVGEIKIRIEGISERILEDYEIDLAEAFTNYERPENLDLPELRRNLTSTEQELARLGPVNMAAIDELKEVEARATFLAQQLEDLSGAKEKLEQIIDQINTTSRRLFQRTFKDIRRNFQDLFRKLYGGGKADLVLQLDAENPDVLEAGLEIVAQPPGKQPKSISLLSGGEKALTAIALLFAVYRTKPSPFCILDEVDAPLDESNTDVYCSMLKEFCGFSQFIVITHNKRTMQYADSIYGITQQERGVSTKISVKLEDVDSEGQLATTSMGQGPFAD